MRNYLIAFFVLMAACAFGANVTFQSFNTNQFNANAAANSVSLNSAGTNIVDSTDLVLNTIYTNSSGSNLLVTVGLVTTPGATAGSGALEINQSPTNNFPFITSLNVYVAIGGSSGINQESVSGFVQPGGVYVATNLQGIVSILANSCQRVYSPIGGGVGPPGPGISGTVQSGVIFSNSQFAGSQNFSAATISGPIVTNSEGGVTLYGPTSGGAPGITASFLDATGLATVTNAVVGILAGQPVVSNYLATTSDVTTNTIGGNFIGSIIPTNGMAFYYNPTNGFVSQGEMAAQLLNKTWYPAPWPNAWTNAVNTTGYITNTGVSGTNNYNMVVSGVVKDWSGSLLTPYWFNPFNYFVQTYAPLTISPSVNLGGITTNIQVTDTFISGGRTNTLYFTNGILMNVTTP